MKMEPIASQLATAPPRLSVVVPCYNEEAVLDMLEARLSAACAAQMGDDFEIVLVNDGSKDATWAKISALAARNPHVLGVDLSRNHGHQLAVTAGLQVCRGDLVMIIDADLQDPPELLGDMLAKIDEGYDVVYGKRRERLGESRFKRATAAMFYKLLNRMADHEIPLDTGDFRLMTRRVVDQLNAMPERFRFIRGMVSWIGFEQVPVEYDRDPRAAGESHYPLHKMIRLALDAITSFSTLPLRIASHLGVMMGLIGFLMLGWALVRWMADGTIIGWTSLIAVVLIMGSVQLLILGVFGDYLGRLYLENKRRPLFIVREIRSQRPPAARAVAPEPFEPLAVVPTWIPAGQRD
ncbi:dolichol-phosphate mannosyltransferase [Novosphingobium sp. PhB165]|uniref:glycosyltransferase family 2 protein n=1 Tax=Novosphingobium sp. PhB165 TaxID=2485105 RepID=UPI001046B679|nr:glycosyltransferase family 2 protein [Novosphingobium sp. PhB165]TCM17105.1 dolichol-phosphate mannosyltransferase [Novosphingobium sp. PhB165]